MKSIKKALLIPAAALLFAGTAQADDPLDINRIDRVLEHASAYGFNHYEEIETKSRGRVEVEGWLDDEWNADVRFDVESGDTQREKRERLITGAWGMNDSDIRQAFEIAQSEGMTAFEEIKIDESGMIEIEGQDANGRDIEISLRQGSDQVSHIERD
ncbi:PepSY domain-containing protein [Halomonas sp. LS-001]